MKVKVSEVLAKARRIVAKGWGQFHAELDGRLCAGAAVAWALDLPAVQVHEPTPELEEACNALVSVLPPSEQYHACNRVIGWNDGRDQTLAKVLAAFGAAIRLAKLNERLAGVTA